LKTARHGLGGAEEVPENAVGVVDGRESKFAGGMNAGIRKKKKLGTGGLQGGLGFDRGKLRQKKEKK